MKISMMKLIFKTNLEHADRDLVELAEIISNHLAYHRTRAWVTLLINELSNEVISQENDATIETIDLMGLWDDAFKIINIKMIEAGQEILEIAGNQKQRRIERRHRSQDREAPLAGGTETTVEPE